MNMDPRTLPQPTRTGTGWQVVATPAPGWHPHLRLLFGHWQSRCHDGRLPSRAGVDPVGLRGILPWIWMLDVQRDPWRFRYRLAGTRFIAVLGFEVTQCWYDEVRPLAWAANRSRLYAVTHDGQPTWRRGPMPLENGSWRDTENLMLPLAADGRTVDIVLGISVSYDSHGLMIA